MSKHRLTTTPDSTRLIGLGELDLVDLLRCWRGEEFCDAAEEKRLGLIVLPAAIVAAEKATGRSISRKVYESTGCDDLLCFVDLPYAPINEILCVQVRNEENEWTDLPDDKWSFRPDLAGQCRTVRIDQDCCACRCRCTCACECPDERWRIEYITGANDCAIAIDPLMQQLVFLMADQLDDHDDARQKTIDRLVESCKVHAMF